MVARASLLISGSFLVITINFFGFELSCSRWSVNQFTNNEDNDDNVDDETIFSSFFLFLGLFYGLTNNLVHSMMMHVVISSPISYPAGKTTQTNWKLQRLHHDKRWENAALARSLMHE